MSFVPGDQPCAEQNFKIGQIYHTRLFLKDGVTPKPGQKYCDKFVIIVGHDNHNHAVGVIVVNSKINNINYSNGLFILHYPLDATKYPEFLNHNSHANCSLLIPLEVERINPKDYRAKLNEEDIHYILETLRDAESIETKKKKRFGIL
jgi:hypothetical protein